MTTTWYDAEVRHEGRLHAFAIPDLCLPVCQACGEKHFTDDADRQVNAALRRHLGVLSPAQIRERIERLQLTPREVAARMGIAEATLLSWLDETQIQSRSMDNLLRVFLAFPQVRDALCGEGQDLQLGLHDLDVHSEVLSS